MAPPTFESITSKMNFILPEPGQYPITDDACSVLALTGSTWSETSDLKGEVEALSMPSLEECYLSSEEEVSSSAGESSQGTDQELCDEHVDHVKMAHDIDYLDTAREVKTNVARRVRLTAAGKPKLVTITVTPLQTPLIGTPPSIAQVLEPDESRCSSVYSECAESFEEPPSGTTVAVSTSMQELTETSNKNDALTSRCQSGLSLQDPGLVREIAKRRRFETVTPPRTPPSMATSDLASSPSSITSTTAITVNTSPPQSKLRTFASSLTSVKRRAQRSEVVNRQALEGQAVQLSQTLPLSYEYTHPKSQHHEHQPPEAFIPPSPPDTPPSRSKSQFQAPKLRRRSSVLNLGNRIFFMIGDDGSPRS